MIMITSDQAKRIRHAQKVFAAELKRFDGKELSRDEIAILMEYHRHDRKELDELQKLKIEYYEKEKTK